MQNNNKKESPYDRIPQDIRDTFTEEQKQHIHAALGVRSWKKHKVDIRASFSVPFLRTQYYLVFLFGKNKRQLNVREKTISSVVTTFIIAILFTVLLISGLLTAYLMKSLLGIDLFTDFSLGIWDWFNS